MRIAALIAILLRGFFRQGLGRPPKPASLKQLEYLARLAAELDYRSAQAFMRDWTKSPTPHITSRTIYLATEEALMRLGRKPRASVPGAHKSPAGKPTPNAARARPS